MAGYLFPESGNCEIRSLVLGDGETCSYRLSGAGEVTIVLVHGGLCDRTYWTFQTEMLSESYRVLAMDLVGHGDSSKTRTDWSIAGLGSDVAAVILDAGVSRAILVGHSIGALVVLEAARQLPKDNVLGVVVVDMLHDAAVRAGGPPPGVRPESAAIRQGMQKGMFTAHSDVILRERILDAMLSSPPEVALPLRLAVSEFDPSGDLRAIEHKPTAFILSDLRPTDAAAIRAFHPESRILVVEGVGHFLMLEDPKTFNSVFHGELLRMEGKVRAM